MIESELTAGVQVDINKNAICYEIVKVGPSCEYVEEGEHCLHISTAGDGEGAGLDQEYCLVAERDIVAHWKKPE